MLCVLWSGAQLALPGFLWCPHELSALQPQLCLAVSRWPVLCISSVVFVPLLHSPHDFQHFSKHYQIAPL